METLHLIRRLLTLLLGAIPAMYWALLALILLVLGGLVSLNLLALLWGGLALLGTAGLWMVVLDVRRGRAVLFMIGGMVAMMPLALGLELHDQWIVTPFWVAAFNLLVYACEAVFSGKKGEVA